MWIKIIRSNRFPSENGEVERIRTSLSFLKEKRNRTKINFLLSVGGHVNDIFRARHDRNSIPRPPGWKSSSLPPVPLIRPRRRLRATRADFKATINSPFDTRVRDRGHHSPSSPSLSFSSFSPEDGRRFGNGSTYTTDAPPYISRSSLPNHLLGRRVIPRLKFRARPRN